MCIGYSVGAEKYSNLLTAADCQGRLLVPAVTNSRENVHYLHRLFLASSLSFVVLFNVEMDTMQGSPQEGH